MIKNVTSYVTSSSSFITVTFPVSSVPTKRDIALASPLQKFFFSLTIFVLLLLSKKNIYGQYISISFLVVGYSVVICSLEIRLFEFSEAPLVFRKNSYYENFWKLPSKT